MRDNILGHLKSFGIIFGMWAFVIFADCQVSYVSQIKIRRVK
jgi:hypothetical protein